MKWKFAGIQHVVFFNASIIYIHIWFRWLPPSFIDFFGGWVFLWEIDEWDLNIPNIIPPQTYHFFASNHQTQSNRNPIKHTSKTNRNISDMMAAFAIL